MGRRTRAALGFDSLHDRSQYSCPACHAHHRPVLSRCSPRMRAMDRLSTALASCAVVAAGVIAGCSDSRVTAPGPPMAASGPTLPRPAQSAKAPVRESFTTAALDDRSLGTIRGGLNTG